MDHLNSSNDAKNNVPTPIPTIWFHRRELDQILRVYGRMVSAGEWRDYAIDSLKDRAVFSIFRRSSEAPDLYDREEPESGAQTGRVRCDQRHWSGPEARASTRPSASRLRQTQIHGRELNNRSVV